MDGKLVFSGAGVCTGGTTTMAIPSTVDYAEIVSAIPAIGRTGYGYSDSGSSDNYVASNGEAVSASADFGHAKIARGGSAVVAMTSLSANTHSDKYSSRFVYEERANVSPVSVSFASDGTLSISGGSSANRFTVYGYQYL